MYQYRRKSLLLSKAYHMWCTCAEQHRNDMLYIRDLVVESPQAKRQEEPAQLCTMMMSTERAVLMSKERKKMSKISTKGTCQFCHSVFSKAAMTKHLEACPRRASDAAGSGKTTKQTQLLHLRVEGRDDPQYWMHLEMPATTTLQTLNNFLRKTWMECC